MAGSNAESLLKSISSRKLKEEIDSSYEGLAGSMKQLGSPTNNMLLASIHGESRRGADEILRLNSTILKLGASIELMSSTMMDLCSLVREQNEILSSSALSSPTTSPREYSRGTEKTAWFYQGTKLVSKSHAYACIISHVIEMAMTHLDTAGKYYPDSVDCGFNTLTDAVRTVSGMRCQARHVQFKETITLKEINSQQFEFMYRFMSSSDPRQPTTLSESMLGQVFNSVTKSIMQDIDWIRQRLICLIGILSAKQIDILKSIRNPLKSETTDELNWDPKVVNPRTSHPLTRDIMDLKIGQQREYMRLIMGGKTVMDALEIARECTDKKK